MRVLGSVAISMDGYMDSGTDQPATFSSKEDLEEVHKLRSKIDAILIGAQTLRHDNPSLTARTENGKDPVKIVVTKSGNIDPSAKFFSEGQAEKIVYCHEDVLDSLQNQLEGQAEIVAFDGKMASILEDLKGRDIQSLMVEGGSHILHQFFDEDLIDDFRLAMSPKKVGNENATTFMEPEDYEQKIEKNMDMYPPKSLGDTTIFFYSRKTS